ncbi:MAG: hypothetical protein RBR74_11285 [Ignavibacteriaceae bacterium]|nr:hypothetical protein [Ignavibacteriaceae bacterium]
MNNIKSTYVPQNRSQNSTRSLIGSDLNKKSLSVGNTSSLYSENVNTTPSAISSPIYGGSIGYRANQRDMQNNGDVGPLASSFLTNRSGSGGQVIGSQQGSNLLSSGSATSTSFRSFVPMNPNTDYREGDITHPGGNPMADSLVSVPVGEGIIPLFLMSISYILILLLRRKF